MNRNASEIIVIHKGSVGKNFKEKLNDKIFNISVFFACKKEELVSYLENKTPDIICLYKDKEFYPDILALYENEIISKDIPLLVLNDNYEDLNETSNLIIFNITEESEFFNTLKNILRLEVKGPKQDETKNLLENQERLDLIFKATQIGLWEWNIKKDEYHTNDQIMEILGEKPKSYKEMKKYIHPEDLKMLEDHLNDVLQKRVSPFKIEYRIKGKNGNWIWILSQGDVTSWSNDGKPLIMGGTQIIITERKLDEEKLKDSEELFRELFEDAPFGYQSLDVNGCFLEVNNKWLEILGYEKEEVIGEWFGNFLAPEYKEKFEERFKLFKETGTIYSEFEMLTKDGKRITVGFDGQISYNAGHVFKQTHCTVNDITQIKIANNRLKESEKKYRLLVDLMPLGMVSHEIILDDSGKPVDYVFLSGNSKYEEQIGKKMEDVIGKTVLEVFPNTEDFWIQKFGEVAITGKPITLENYAKELDKYFKVSAFQTEYKKFAVIVDDITIEKKKQERIIYLSNHDYLSGLYNRRYFVNRFNEFDHYKKYPLGIIMLDINGLKIINDAFGHSVGDIAIKKVGEVCFNHFQDRGVVSRIGGDEFAIVLPNTSQKEIDNSINKLRLGFSKIKVRNISISVAIGYELKLENSNEDLDEFLKLAENKMYRHKLAEGISVRNKTIKVILKTLTDKYAKERLHSERVSEICKKIGEQLNFKIDEIKELELAGMFHDIGKISIPDVILNKNGKLTKEEYQKIKSHSEMGYQILRAADEYSDLAIHALYHHERWDGLGYPRGLKGNDIPLFSRIIAVADAYEAMTAERPYKEKMTEEEAIAEIKRNVNKQFDEQIAKVFVEKVLGFDWD